jgi:uncharacterized protein YndB with AHSA1/START domain
VSVTSTRVTRHIAARPRQVYRALVDAEAVARWRFPAGMSIQVHEFDGREGGRVHVSLTYDAPDRTGKTTTHTDTYRGRFVELVPDERIVEVDAFETDDPALRGEMTSTITLTGTDGGGTSLVAVHDGLPRGIRPEDNELGWHEALDRLAALVESTPCPPRSTHTASDDSPAGR